MLLGSLVALGVLASTRGAPPPRLRVDARVETGVQPKSVTLAPDGQLLAVCNFGQSQTRNVVLLDPDDLSEQAAIDFIGTATESAWRSASELLVSDFSRGLLITIDVRNATIVDTIKVGSNPKGIALAADGTTAFVTNWTGASVSVVDLQSREVTQTIRTGRRPRGVTLTGTGAVVVGAMWDHRVEEFAADDNGWRSVASEQRVCSYPRDVRTTPDGALLVVSCSGNRRVRWYDTSTRRLVGQAFVGPNPRSLAIAPSGDWGAVANFHGRSVSVVDFETGRSTTTIVPDTDGIVGVAVAQGLGPVVFATSFGTREVLRLVSVNAPRQWDPLGKRRLRKHGADTQPDST